MHRLIPLVLIVLTLYISNSIGVPLSPESVELLRESGRLNEVVERRAEAFAKGVSEPGPNILESIRQVRRDEPITLYVPVIIVDFDDNEANEEVYSNEHYQSLLFSIDEYETGSMREWYLENSFGEVNIIGEVVGWLRMPEDYAYYVDGQHGFGVYPRNSQGLIRHAVDAANEHIDYSRYDNDRNGVCDVIMLVHSGSGAEANGGDEDMIWSHAWALNNNAVRRDGVMINRFAVMPEDGNIGVFGHELGHALFALPDLYDRTYESYGIGYWSMMSHGTWHNGGRTPCHFDAWCKIQAGFVEPINILQDVRNFVIPPIIQEPAIYKLWRNAQPGQEYFLIENRPQMGFDAYLHEGGLIIYHIDEGKRNSQNDQPWYPDNEDEGHYLVAIEQSDGEWHMERRENAGDRGDPYPGITNNRHFNSESTPSSRDYNGEDTGVAIENITRERNNIIADLYVGIDPEDRELVISLTRGWNIISFNIVPNEEYWEVEEGPDVFLLFEQYLDEQDRYIVEIVKDEEGRFSILDLEYNGIPHWNLTRGYYIKVREPIEFRFQGEAISPQVSINLVRGWNIIGYLPTYQLNASAPQFYVLSPIIDYVEIAKDALGDFLLPSMGFSNMQPWREGRGYLVKVSQDVRLVYPARGN